MDFTVHTVESLRDRLLRQETGPKKKRHHTTPQQLAVLVAAFAANPRPSRHQRDVLALQTAMSSRAVQVWFQNRRAKLQNCSDATKTTTTVSAPASPMVVASSSSSSMQQQQQQPLLASPLFAPSAFLPPTSFPNTDSAELLSDSDDDGAGSTVSSSALSLASSSDPATAFTVLSPLATMSNPSLPTTNAATHAANLNGGVFVNGIYSNLAFTRSLPDLATTTTIDRRTTTTHPFPVRATRHRRTIDPYVPILTHPPPPLQPMNINAWSMTDSFVAATAPMSDTLNTPVRRRHSLSAVVTAASTSRPFTHDDEYLHTDIERLLMDMQTTFHDPATTQPRVDGGTTALEVELQGLWESVGDVTLFSPTI